MYNNSARKTAHKTASGQQERPQSQDPLSMEPLLRAPSRPTLSSNDDATVTTQPSEPTKVMRVQGGDKVQVREYRTQKEFQDNVV